MQLGAKQLPILVAAIATLAVLGLLGTAFAPALLGYSPLGLIALSPTGRHLVLVATTTSLVPFVFVAVVRRCAAAVLAYALGRIYGDRLLEWMREKAPRTQGILGWLERCFRRAGPLLLFVFPGLTCASLAGVVGMRFRIFLPLVAIGQAGWMTLAYYLGDTFKEQLGPIVTWLTDNILETTLVSIVAVATYELYRRRSGRAIAPLVATNATKDVQRRSEL